MKKISILFVLGFLALSFNSFSQIKVSSTGKVGINQNTPAYNLDLFGTARLWTTYGYLLFDSSGHGGVATLYPAQDWIGSLGKTDKKFNKICTYEVYYDNLYDWSDERLKENIEPLEKSLNKIKLLKGVSYNMKQEFYNVEDPELLEKLMKKNQKDMGFLAQEVEKVFPEAVSYDEEFDIYSVNYVKLIPVLVEALKEQQVQIESLQKDVELLSKTK